MAPYICGELRDGDAPPRTDAGAGIGRCGDLPVGAVGDGVWACGGGGVDGICGGCGEEA